MLKMSEQPQKELNVSGGKGLKNTLTYLPTVGAWTKFAAILNYIITALTKARPSTLSNQLRPFRLTHAIARARVSTCANLSVRAICRTHEKSFS